MRGTALQNGFFVALLVLVTVAFVGLIFYFLMPVFWAVVLAVLFYPMYQGLVTRLRGHSSLAAGATVVIVIALVISPLLVVGVMISREVTSLYERFEQGEVSLLEPLENARRAVPALNAYLSPIGIDASQVRQRIAAAGTSLSDYLASHALSLGQGGVRFTVSLALTLYLLFFFVRDGDRLIVRILRALPLSQVREEQLLVKFSEVSRATIKVTCVIGAVQGTLGGLLFWVLDLPAPVLCGMLMGFLSFVPAVGPAVIWGPAAVILLFTGELAKGLIILAVGTLAIGLVDNVLRPVLVGRDTRMPDFLVLLATIGGLAVFGVSGFVIGPILASFFVAIWGMFEQEFRDVPDIVNPAEREPANNRTQRRAGAA